MRRWVPKTSCGARYGRSKIFVLSQMLYTAKLKTRFSRNKYVLGQLFVTKMGPNMTKITKMSKISFSPNRFKTSPDGLRRPQMTQKGTTNVPKPPQTTSMTQQQTQQQQHRSLRCPLRVSEGHPQGGNKIDFYYTNFQTACWFPP